MESAIDPLAVNGYPRGQPVLEFQYEILRCLQYWIMDMILESGQEGTTHSCAHKTPIFSGYFIAFERGRKRGL
jgi:hypothetical protein